MSDTETNDVSPQNLTTQEVKQLTTGRVKWFNNKAGYGFITVTSGEHTGVDVFVHHSVIHVGSEQYRYLVQGEYVIFNMCPVTGTDNGHKWQAGDVKGPDCGKLMCETRHETREARSNYKTDENSGVAPGRRAREVTGPRVRTRGPGPREGEEWMLVRRRNPRNAVTSPTKRETLRPRNVARQTSTAN